jgi:hypothetical protein
VVSAIHVEDDYRLHLPQVSGLGWRSHPRTGLPQLLAVSDEQDAVVTAGFDAGEIHEGLHEVTGLPRALRSERRAEWEAVAGDAAGRVLIVREAGSELIVLAPDLSFERSISLRHDWRSDTHHGLESLLLLRHGHVLSAKQEDPVVLVEFGPRRDRARGFGPEQLLGDDEPFDVPAAGDRLQQLKVWDVRDAGETPASINDLALDGRHVMAVSSRSRRVARLGHGGPAEDDVRVTGAWDLADDRLADADGRVEGLLIHPRLGSFVSMDTDERRTRNLFRVTAPWSGD